MPNRDKREFETSPYSIVQPDRTRPHLLKRIAKEAAKAFIRSERGQQLPAQKSVGTQGRAAVGVRALNSFRRLLAVAAEVMALDVRLTSAEAKSQAAKDRLVALEKEPASTVVIAPSAVLELPASVPSRRRRLIGPLLEWPALVGIAAGEAALTYLAAKVTTLGPTVRQLFTAAVGIASVFTAVVAARLLDRLAVGRDGKEDPRRRRWLDVGTGLLALVSGTAVVLAVARMRETFLKAVYDGMAHQSAALVIDQRYLPWLLVLGVALLGLGAAFAYAAIPDNPGWAARWAKALIRPLIATYLNRRLHRKRQADLEALRQAVAEVDAEVAELLAALARLAPEVLAAEEAALTDLRVQAAQGEAIQHDLGEHLTVQVARRQRGVPERFKDWWRGRAADVPDTVTDIESLSTDEQSWVIQVARITSPAKRVLIRRGFLADDGRGNGGPVSANGKGPYPPRMGPYPAGITARKGEAP